MVRAGGAGQRRGHHGPVALAKGLLVYVGPLTATFPLFTLAFSVLFFRQEAIPRNILAGVALISAGVAAITALGWAPPWPDRFAFACRRRIL